MERDEQTKIQADKQKNIFTNHINKYTHGKERKSTILHKLIL